MKYEYQSMPTLRKRTLKIIAEKDSFLIVYMNSQQRYYSKQEVLEAIERDLEVIEGWGQES